MGFEADLSTFSETTPVQELGPLMEDASFNLVRSQTVSPGRPGLSLRARPTSSSDSRYSQVSFVRSQPLGLPSSMRSPRMDDSPGKMEAELSSRHTVQLSPCKSGNFGLKRSDSLPIFPPDKQAFKQDDPFKLVGSVDDLPVRLDLDGSHSLSDRSCWISRIPRLGRLLSVSSDTSLGEILLMMYSSVAVYLAHVLRITPAPIVSDLQRVINVSLKRITDPRHNRLCDEQEIDWQKIPALQVVCIAKLL